MIHQPVLLQEVIAGLNLAPGLTVLDATVNRAGHSKVIAQAIGPTGHLIGLDADNTALAEAKSNLAGAKAKVALINGNFRDLGKLLAEAGVTQIDRALFDLGLSSQELEISGRGFSFLRDEPLLMTFSDQVEGPEQLTAREVVNTWAEDSLTDIIKGFGEERFAGPIAKAIVDARMQAPIETTFQLGDIIRTATPGWYHHRKSHYATKTFQAIRMAVNGEIEAIKQALPQAFKLLTPGGRLAVISFHSLEARLVKQYFKEQASAGLGTILTKHATKPARPEVLSNPRSRSAELRIIQKI